MIFKRLISIYCTLDSALRHIENSFDKCTASNNPLHAILIELLRIGMFFAQNDMGGKISMDQMVTHLSNVGVATKVLSLQFCASFECESKIHLFVQADVSTQSCLVAKEFLQALDYKVNIFVCVVSIPVGYLDILHTLRKN